MEGAALAAKNRLDTALFTAWHTAVFALNGYGGKLKPLAQYLHLEPDAPAIKNAKLIAGFHSLKKRGFDVQISRNEIN